MLPVDFCFHGLGEMNINEKHFKDIGITLWGGIILNIKFQFVSIFKSSYRGV